MSVSIRIDRELSNGVTTVSVNGELTPGSLPDVRRALLETASERPTAIIAELSGLWGLRTNMLCGFAAAAHRAIRDWGVPVVVCASDSAVTQQLEPFKAFTRVYGTRTAALRALRSAVRRYPARVNAPVPVAAVVA